MIPVNLRIILLSSIPFLIGTFILSLVTDIFYAGGKRESLASAFEAQIIEVALKGARYDASDTSVVKTVTLNSEEFNSFPHGPRSIIRDASIDVYAKVLEKALQANPEIVIVSWLHGAHYDDKNYLTPLISVIDQYKAKDRVILSFPTFYYSNIAEDLKSNYRVIEGEDCVYHVNLYCSVPEDWDEWMISVLAQTFWKQRRLFAVSYNLPHVLPNILANIPEPKSIPDYSFTEVLQGNAKGLQDAKLIAIGADVTQHQLFKNSPEEIQKTFVALSKERRDLMTDGLPYHKFWAGLAQMFIEDSTISVPPRSITIALALTVSIFIVFILLKLGSGFALFFYIIASISYIALNCLAANYLRVYVPMFEILYFGLATVIAITFFAVSRTTFQHSLLSAQNEGASELFDLKQNFISLISHNLNTPVAKLRGLLDILKARPIYAKAHKLIDLANCYAIDLQFTVRTVLLSTSLEQDAVSKRTYSFAQLAEELDDYLRPFLRARNATSSCSCAEFSKFARFDLDVKFLTHAILCLIWQKDYAGKQLDLNLEFDEESESLLITLSTDSCAEASLRPFTAKAIDKFLNLYLNHHLVGTKLTHGNDEILLIMSPEV